MATAGRMADRAVHLKIQPRTRNIRESREILRVLKRYGPVVSFRNLQYDTDNPAPNVALAVFQSPTSATNFLEATPLRINPASRPAYHEPSGDVAGLNYSLFGNAAGREAFENVESDEPARELTIIADRSLADHFAYVQRNRQYWGYRTSLDENAYIQQALKQSVPVDAYSAFPTEAKDLPRRLVTRNLRMVAERKTLWQTYEEVMQQQQSRETRENTSTREEHG